MFHATSTLKASPLCWAPCQPLAEGIWPRECSPATLGTVLENRMGQQWSFSLCRSFSLFPFLLPFLLRLIKKHLLATHCISQQNLYFRHVEPWILNLNTNGAGRPYYSIPSYLSIITPSWIQHADRCKWVPKMQSPKNNRRQWDSLILIKCPLSMAEFKAEGPAKIGLCFTITPDLLYCSLEKTPPNFLY